MFTIKTLIVFVLFHLSVGVRGFCDEPDIPANSYITEKSHNGYNNRYDEGSYIDYHCEDDYIMNGNIRITCKNGKWTKVDFQCTATFCEVLTSIPNGNVSQNADIGGRNYFFSKAVYTCKKGYRIFGTQETYTRHCVEDYKWNGTEPLCQVPHESCSDLTLENGKIKTSDASLGEYTIGCDQGYHLHVRTDEPCTCNNQQITCAVFCREDDCTIPSQFDSRLTLSQNKDGIQRYVGGDNVIKAGDDVIFNCSKVTDLIYEPFERLFKCRFGKWIAVEKNSWSFGTHGTFPECRKAECDPPCKNDGKCHIDNKCVCGESYTGNRCEQAKCPEACEKNGGRCDYPGDCQCPVGSYGKNCEISGCKLPTEAAAYKGTKRVFRVHESIYAESMTCPQNYELSDSRMTCLESGSWDNIITCLSVRGFCDEPDVPAHSFIKEIIQEGNNSRYDEGSYVVYRCEDGYILEGNIRRICQQNGKWTNVNFQCTEITCKYIRPPENGYVSNEPNYEVGYFIEFECNAGYRMSGSQRYLCGTDGEWRYGIPAKCTAIYCPELTSIPNGEVFQDSFDGVRNNYMSEAEYTCKRGYRIFAKQDKYIRVCGADGQWSGVVPSCEAPQCDEITPYFGGTVTYHGGRRRFTKAVLKCNPGFSMYPNENMIHTCNRLPDETYSWDPMPSFCYKKQELDVPENCIASTTANELLHRDSYTLYARSGFELKQNNQYFDANTGITITNNNGTLEPTPPECKPARCSTTDTNMIVHYMDGKRAIGKVESGHDYKFMCPNDFEFRDDKYLNESHVTGRCDLGKFKDVPTPCVKKRCRLDNNAIALRSGVRKLSVVEHNDQVHVKCDSVQNELLNPMTDVYEDPFYVRCNYGKFSKAVNELTCPPKRCDTAQLQNTDVLYLNQSKADEFVQSGKEYLLRCDIGYEIAERPNIEFIRSHCKYGSFEMVPICIPKRCHVNNNDIVSNLGDKISYIHHGSQISGKCRSDKKELYNPDTDKYQDSFDVSCNYGEFSEDVNKLICRPKRCNTSLLKNIQVLYLNSSATGRFVESTSRYIFRCEDKYEFTDNTISKTGSCESGEFSGVDNCSPKSCTVMYPADKILLRHKDDLLVVDIGTVVSHNTEMFASCQQGYELSKDNNAPSSPTTKCEFGVLKMPQCVEKSCFNKAKEGECYKRIGRSKCTKREFYVRHNKQIILECIKKYSMMPINPNNKTTSDDNAVFICDKGILNKSYQCSPDPCPIPLLFNASTNHTLDKIESGDEITFTCNEGHHIQDTVNDRSWTGQCKAATLKNVPNGCVPDNCVLSSVKNGRYIDVESEEMVYRTIGHGDKVQLQCLDGFNMVNSKNEIVTTEVPHIECDKGSIMTNTYYCKKCINGKNETKQAIGGVENNTTESEIRDDIMKCKEYDVDKNDVPTTKPTTDSVESTTVNSNEKVINTTDAKDCVIEESKVYKYTDENGDEISTIRNGGSVKVDCLYPNSYYYDYDGYDDSHYIHCKNGALTPVSLTCDDTAESCSDLTLTNGQIKHDVQLDKYTIECNQGFHLNVRSEVPCTCDNQTLTCAGGKIPVCLEDDCTIPSQFDSRLTLTQNKDGNQEYIGGDNVIKAGDDVIFSCSKVTNMIYEPFNRSLKCREGKWNAIDKYGWSFVTNGTFPECREAECDPSCENDGKCHIDNKCVCGESFTGDRCEQVKCPEACEKNGGRCDYLGVCECLAGSYGKNCEINGCDLPAGAAPYQGIRRRFAVFENLFAKNIICPPNYQPSDPLMTCLDDGSWDKIIICLRTNFKYVISIQLSTQRHSSTKDDVYIELVGTNGKRTNKIEMYTSGANGLSEINYFGKDVTPIDHVVISKKTNVAVDDNVLISYASIFVPEHDDYYVFKDQHHGNKWLTSDTPRTFTISAHPERCVHTYGQALNRTPLHRASGGFWNSVRGCKQACVKEERFRCASVYVMPAARSDKVYCTLYRESASTNYFKNNTRQETQAGYKSYNRICKKQYNSGWFP